jgi:hypothetical protein
VLYACKGSTPSSLVRKREGERKRERGRGRESKRERERGREKGIESEKEGEREREYLFLKGMTGALAPFSYLVIQYLRVTPKLTQVEHLTLPLLALPTNIRKGLKDLGGSLLLVGTSRQRRKF